MPFSGFSEFGLDGFSGGPPLAERIYESLWANLNGQGAVENYGGKGTGNYTDAKVFAWSKAIARWLTAGRRLSLQIDPDTVLELLVEREAQYGVVVPVGATLAERRLALRVAMTPPGDGSYGDIRQVLLNLLGPQFVDLRKLPEPSQVTMPVNPQFGPGLFVKPTARRKTFRLLHEVSSPGQLAGTDLWAYTHPDGSVVAPADRLQTDDVVVIDPGQHTLRERVIIGAVGELDGHAAASGGLANGHDPGAVVTTQPWPYWYSKRRHWLVVLTPAAAVTPEVRRQVNRLMRKCVRGVTTWDIQADEDPFILDFSPLDATPLH